MKTIKHRYLELLQLTQLFLLREYAISDIKTVDPVLMSYFQKKGKTAPAPIKTTQNFQPVEKPPSQLSTSIKPPESMPKPLTPKPQSIVQPVLKPFEPPKPSPQPQPAQKQQPVANLSAAAAPKEPQDKSRKISLEPQAIQAAQSDFTEFRKILPSLFPDWKLSDNIPDDTLAIKNKNIWLSKREITPVIILSFHDNPQHQTFLANIAKAITLRLAPARVISAPELEKNNQWDDILKSPQLKLVISSDYELYLHPKLMSHYREEKDQGKHILHQTPLLLLSDLSLYLKEPQLKSFLWRAICNEFK